MTELDGCPGTTCRARVTLTLGIPEQMFQTAHLLMMENNCANLNWNPSKLVGVGVPTKIWLWSVTLVPPERMFQMAHLPVIENNCVKLFWNPSTIVEIMVQTKLDRRTYNCDCDNYISLIASGLDKNESCPDHSHQSLTGNSNPQLFFCSPGCLKNF